MKSDFALAFNEILEARALPKEIVLEAIQQALVSAYRRDANLSSSQQQIQAIIDPGGAPQILVEKEVVDNVIEPRTEVLLSEAQRHAPDAQLGDMVMVPIENIGANFGRIAAQTAKQVILQRIREAERETLYDEFIERQGDLITGTVQSVSAAGVTLSLLGRAEAIMPRAHQMPGERHRPHEKVRVYVVEVNKSTRGPQIVVSRTHKDMLRRLLEYEVPEIYNGQVEIKNIAREAGYRSKVAVYAQQETIDPVGACVGMKGMRIQNIIKELNDEKIDVIEWDADPAKFIAKALSPARVSGVYLTEQTDQLRTATVVVSEDHLSLAIGREGQNARLAAKLTGWRIDIKSITETAIEDLAALNKPPLTRIKEIHTTLIDEVERILTKKQNNRLVSPEEYSLLSQFVDLVENTKIKEIEELESERHSMLDAVRPLVPAAAFRMPLTKLELADDIVKALGRIDNVGDLMIRVLADESYLAEMLAANNAGDDALEAIKYSLDDLALPEILMAEQQAALQATEVEEVAPAEVVAEVPVAIEAVETEAAVVPGVEPTTSEEDEALPAFPDVEIEEDEEEAAARKSRAKVATHEKEAEEWEFEEQDEEVAADGQPKRKKKKDKQRRVQLVYDEDLGEVIAKRRRKGSRRRDFDDFGSDE